MRGWLGWVTVVGSAGAIGAFVGGAAGVVAGLLALAGGAVALRRMESGASRREREQAVADLPIAADLLSAALRAGAPPEHAAMVVGEALGGPVGIRLVRVARALRLGATPEAAWRHVADVPGGDRMAGAATRSAERGSALTRALDHQASDLRAVRVAAADAAAHRVGVLVVLPLGLCFLPAFLLAGVVPVVVAVLGDVLGQSP